MARKTARSATWRARAGFTRIELLVVVVITGILAAVAMPSCVAAQDKGRNRIVAGWLSNTGT